MGKPVATRKKPHTFSPFNLISVIEFLNDLKLACVFNGVNKDAATRLSQLFMNNTASTVLKARLSV